MIVFLTAAMSFSTPLANELARLRLLARNHSSSFVAVFKRTMGKSPMVVRGENQFGYFHFDRCDQDRFGRCRAALGSCPHPGDDARRSADMQTGDSEV